MEQDSNNDRSEPGEVQPERSRFGRVLGRNSSDYLMRTAQQHHVQISVMADTKANIMITVSSIILTLSIAQLDDNRMRAALLTLCGFTLLSLMLAILAILPKFTKLEIEDEKLPQDFNLIFFGHFTAIPRDRFLDELEKVLEDDAKIYDILGRDLYSIGTYLDRWKYRYLRWSYIALLIGFVVTSIVSTVTLMM